MMTPMVTVRRIVKGNPDYDCSSFVYYALKHAGLDVGSSAFNTSSEGAALEKAGFERHDWAKVSDLQTGDVVWSSSHTEIYIGDGRFVGAHHDENGGVTGPKAGDQTGNEISVTSYASGYTAYYRYKGSMNVTNSDGSASSRAGRVRQHRFHERGRHEREGRRGLVQRAAGAEQLLRDVRVRPVHVVDVMRAKKLGWKNVGQYWGNGQDWARSGAAAGYKTTTDAPVAGSIISWPAGVQDSDPTYGHVGIVESVDTAKGTITTSEKGAGYKVYSRTMPIRNGGTYVLPNDKLTGMGASGSSGTEQCVTGDDSTSDVSGDKASAADAKEDSPTQTQGLRLG